MPTPASTKCIAMQIIICTIQYNIIDKNSVEEFPASIIATGVLPPTPHIHCPPPLSYILPGAERDEGTGGIKTKSLSPGGKHKNFIRKTSRKLLYLKLLILIEENFMWLSKEVVETKTHQ